VNLSQPKVMTGSVGQPELPEIGRVAVAVVHGEPPTFFLAEDDDVLSRVLALELVAQTPASEISNEARLARIQDALLNERWADALGEWIDETGTVVDAYPDEAVWTEERVDTERASLEIRMAPMFRD
jgi:hypothetical protein